MPSNCSADASAGAGSPAAVTPWPGRPADLRLRAVVQRSVHDLTSLQYQRTSSDARSPSGNSRPSGRTMPHREHEATSNARRRLLSCSAAGESASAGRGRTGSCSDCPASGMVITDETCGATNPPRGTPVTRPSSPRSAARTVTREVNWQARSYPSPLTIGQARSYQARSSKGSDQCSGGSRQSPKSLSSGRPPIRLPDP